MNPAKFNPYFWVHAAVDPTFALDLKDKNGDTDHSKIVPFLVIVGQFVLHVVAKPMDLMTFIAMLAAAFGYGMFRTFLASKAATRTEALDDRRVSEERTIVETKTNHTITETRTDDGFEPSGKVLQVHDE